MKIREVDVQETKKDVPFVVGGVYRGAVIVLLIMIAHDDYALVTVHSDYGDGANCAVGIRGRKSEVHHTLNMCYEYVPDAELVVPARKERE